MTNSLVAIGGFAVLALLMVIRVPIGFAMGIAGVLGFGSIVGVGPALRLFAQVPLTVATDYSLSVIPMFLLMGTFAAHSGMSSALFRAARAWIGHFPGGLALSTLLSCAGFAAINGSSIATAATMTRVALPEMEQAGYGNSLSTGVIAAGGTLGIMIPPSAAFAIYGILTDQNIGKLFMAGILPGLLGLAMYAITIRVLHVVRREHFSTDTRASWGERFSSLRDIWPVVLLFASIIGGIYWGWVTITEAAGVGAVGAWAIGAATGRLGFRSTLKCLAEALGTTAAIFAIVIGALMFGYFLTITQTTQSITNWMAGLPIGPYGVLALIIAGYLILGAIMDEIAIALLTLPIVFPVVMELHFDPVWFGVVFVMVVSIGMVSPPIGMNVFVISGIAERVKISEIYRGVLPFIVSDLIRLLILIAFPVISLALPATM